MARFCPSRGFILDLGGMGVCCSILFCPRLQLQAINRSVSALETCLFFIQADCWLQDAKTCPPPFCFTVQCIPPPPTFSTNVVRDVEKHAGSGAVSGLSDHETISMHQYLKSYDVPSRKLNSSKLPAFPYAGYCTWTTLRIEKGATSLRTAWHDWYYQALRNFPASQSPKQKGRRTAWS